MLKQTLLNAVFTGAAQAASLIAVLFLAVYLEPELFGTLAIQLSSAALLSIFLTLQFERVYVRVRDAAFQTYLVFHLRIFFCVAAVFWVCALPFALGPSSVLLAAAIGFSQIALYAHARRGEFRRIWLLKTVQGVSLLTLCMGLYGAGSREYYWLAFVGSYICAGLFVLNQEMRQGMFSLPLRGWFRRFKYSMGIAAMALASLLSSTGTRELPVLLAGLLGQSQLAATAGLVMRVVGAPVGLIARSAAAVVASFVASRRFDTTAMVRLLTIPVAGLVYICLVAMGFCISPMLAKYEAFTTLLCILTPYFLVRAYVGLLGPAIVFFRVQRLDLVCNLAVAVIAVTCAVLVWLELLHFNLLAVAISVAAVASGILLVRRLTNVIGKMA